MFNKQQHKIVKSNSRNYIYSDKQLALEDEAKRKLYQTMENW